jgi:ubiquitin C-terminal hydrolase
MHQDAHEFLNFLLNRLAEEMEEEKKAAVPAEPSIDDRASIVHPFP